MPTLHLEIGRLPAVKNNVHPTASQYLAIETPNQFNNNGKDNQKSAVFLHRSMPNLTVSFELELEHLNESNLLSEGTEILQSINMQCAIGHGCRQLADATTFLWGRAVNSAPNLNSVSLVINFLRKVNVRELRQKFQPTPRAENFAEAVRSLRRLSLAIRLVYIFPLTDEDTPGVLSSNERIQLQKLFDCSKSALMNLNRLRAYTDALRIVAVDVSRFSRMCRRGLQYHITSAQIITMFYNSWATKNL